jgi:histone deacetylase complex regulatory component SIN3
MAEGRRNYESSASFQKLHGKNAWAKKLLLALVAKMHIMVADRKIIQISIIVWDDSELVQYRNQIEIVSRLSVLIRCTKSITDLFLFSR